MAVLMNLNDQRRNRVEEVGEAIAHSLFVQKGPAQARDTTFRPPLKTRKPLFPAA